MKPTALITKLIQLTRNFDSHIVIRNYHNKLNISVKIQNANQNLQNVRRNGNVDFSRKTKDSDTARETRKNQTKHISPSNKFRSETHRLHKICDSVFQAECHADKESVMEVEAQCLPSRSWADEMSPPPPRRMSNRNALRKEKSTSLDRVDVPITLNDKQDDNTMFACDQCDLKFNTNRGLGSHKRQKHVIPQCDGATDSPVRNKSHENVTDKNVENTLDDHVKEDVAPLDYGESPPNAIPPPIPKPPPHPPCCALWVKDILLQSMVGTRHCTRFL